MADEKDDFDGILLEETTGIDEGTADLELDAFQATEIRSIFLTTLPEYLEPVRQMLGQLSQPSDDPSEIHAALDTTLQSIQTAASRVAIDDIAELVREMREQLPDPDQAIDSDEMQGVWASFRQIEQIAGAEATGQERSHSETIVAALARVGGVERGVLEKLTAAGLTTVDQIRMADPKEIMAVSGLDAAAVEVVVRAVSQAHPEAAGAIDAPLSEGVPAPPGAPSPELRLAPNDASADASSSIDSLLEAMLRRQVESELELEQLRGQVLRLRTNLQNLRAELGLACAEREALQKKLLDARTAVGQKLQALTHLEAQGADLQRQEAAEKQHVARITRHVSTLEGEWDSTDQERRRLADEVERVTQTVDQLLDKSRNVNFGALVEGGSPTRRS